MSFLDYLIHLGIKLLILILFIVLICSVILGGFYFVQLLLNLIN